jgi:hypothetical protein
MVTTTMSTLPFATLLILLVYVDPSTSSSASASVVTAQTQQQQRQLQFPELPDWAEEFLNETINGDSTTSPGGGGAFGDGNGGFDWDSENAWNDWLTGLFEGGGAKGDNTTTGGGNGGGLLPGMDGLDLDGSICMALETAVGMSAAFGVAAQCSCSGGLTTGMNITCSLEECVAGTDVCGSVGMNLTFGGTDAAKGTVTASACADFPNDDYLETCFMYGIDVTTGMIGETAPTASQSCQASYGGNPCDCTIEDFCLQVDCQMYLPGATMDTCQLLSLVNVSDSMNWLPNFEMFQPGYEFDADVIPWETMQWDAIDWTNFDMKSVQWSDDWLDTPWTALIGGGGNTGGEGQQLESSSAVCSLLQHSLDMSENLFLLDGGGCKCSDVVEGKFSIGCNFTNVCNNNDDNDDNNDVAVGIDVNALDNNVNNGNRQSFCGNVEMSLDFAVLAGVNSTICIDYADDNNDNDDARTTTPRTCFTYTIPIADQPFFGDGATSSSTCSATYGGDANICDCEIDENLCIKIDCSEFGGSDAVMDSCQYVGFNDGIIDNDDVTPFVLRIGGGLQALEQDDSSVQPPQQQEGGEPNNDVDDESTSSSSESTAAATTTAGAELDSNSDNSAAPADYTLGTFIMISTATGVAAAAASYWL